MEELVKQLKSYGFSDDYLKIVENGSDIETSVPSMPVETDNDFNVIPENYLSGSALIRMSFSDTNVTMCNTVEK